MPGAIVPLYTDPGLVWDQLASAIAQTPDLPFAVILNPNSGVGSTRSERYVANIPALLLANVTLYGYVDTNYARRDIADIEREIGDWIAWYDITNIFFDDVAPRDEHAAYYRTLTASARTLGVRATIGNPGTLAPASFVKIFDTIVAYEDPGYPRLASLEAAVDRFGLEQLAIMVIGAPYDDRAIDELIVHAHWIYASERGDDAYAELPLAFDSLLDRLHIAQAADFDLHPGL